MTLGLITSIFFSCRSFSVLVLTPPPSRLRFPLALSLLIIFSYIHVYCLASVRLSPAVLPGDPCKFARQYPARLNPVLYVPL